MITFPNAKINLGLNIVEKRADGYHNLETIFYPIPVKDALELIVPDAPEKKIRLIQSGIPIGSAAEDNLVVKAYKLLDKDYNLPPVEVYLRKEIPSGAGLGGGSSDAAFMLKLINDTFKLNIPIEKLEEYAALLGADCAFFIRNKPVFATGIGNIFSPISLSLKDYGLIVVKPDIFVSTREAFANIKPSQPKKSLKEIILSPVSEWKELMVNDFEKSVFPQFPEIGKIKEELYNKGAIYAAMSGSGSSVFGIFEPNVPLPEIKHAENAKVFSSYFPF